MKLATTIKNLDKFDEDLEEKIKLTQESIARDFKLFAVVSAILWIAIGWCVSTIIYSGETTATCLLLGTIAIYYILALYMLARDFLRAFRAKITYLAGFISIRTNRLVYDIKGDEPWEENQKSSHCTVETHS